MDEKDLAPVEKLVEEENTSNDKVINLVQESIIDNVENIDTSKSKQDVTSINEENREETSKDDNVDTKISKDILGEPTTAEDYSKNITYQEDGIAIYTDPHSNMKYKFCENTNNWEPIENTNKEENVYENDYYKWCFETNKWIPKVQSSVQYSDIDGLHTYKDEDGTVFFYDQSKKAWFPKIDDDFMAIYQLNYGFDKDGNQNRKVVDNDGFKIPISIKENIADKIHLKMTDKEETIIESTTKKKRKAPEPPKWFDIEPEQNTKVYVSNLPLDITEEEFIELMSKCGLIMKDPITQKFKVKLYVDSNGNLKGDGLCDYINQPSVDLALTILDGYEIRGKRITTERARFQMRGEYNPALKPKRKKQDKEKLSKLKQKLLDWRPDKMRGERSKHERVVIIQNLFDPEIFDRKVELILEYQNDLRDECKKCGNVRKVIIYDRHVDGIASISMSCPEEADLVVQMMNRRFYGKRRLIAEIWDGKTKYKVDETTNEEKHRLTNWNKYLEESHNESIKEKEIEEKPNMNTNSSSEVSNETTEKENDIESTEKIDSQSD